ncbi:MAG: hypothetical protein WCS94_16105 [Verrucomicrobiota bacterium]
MKARTVTIGKNDRRTVLTVESIEGVKHAHCHKEAKEEELEIARPPAAVYLIQQLLAVPGFLEFHFDHDFPLVIR